MPGRLFACLLCLAARMGTGQKGGGQNIGNITLSNNPKENDSENVQ